MGLRGRVPGCGHTAQRSGDEPGEACRDDGEDILDREHRGQGDPNAIGRFGDLGDELDQPVAQGVELDHAPGRAFWHEALEGPEQPIGGAMQKEPDLVGAGSRAGGPIGGQVKLFSRFSIRPLWQYVRS